MSHPDTLKSTIRDASEKKWATPEHKARRDALLASSTAVALTDFCQAAGSPSIPLAVQDACDRVRHMLDALEQDTPPADVLLAPCSMYLLRQAGASLLLADMGAQKDMREIPDMDRDMLEDARESLLFEVVAHEPDLLEGYPQELIERSLDVFDHRIAIGRAALALCERVINQPESRPSTAILSVERQLRGNRHFFDLANLRVEQCGNADTVELRYVDHLGTVLLGTYHDKHHKNEEGNTRGLPYLQWVLLARCAFHGEAKSDDMQQGIETPIESLVELADTLLQAIAESVGVAEGMAALAEAVETYRADVDA